LGTIYKASGRGSIWLALLAETPDSSRQDASCGLTASQSRDSFHVIVPIQRQLGNFHSMIGSSDLQSLGVYIPLFYEVDEMTDRYPTDKAEESRGLEHLHVGSCWVPANVANDATWSLSDFLVIRVVTFVLRLYASPERVVSRRSLLSSTI
jgi:hypothetical protein